MGHKTFYRWLFSLAGIYNIGWGIYSLVNPQWLFRFAGLPLERYPEIFACLGMMVALYGILYFEVARLPEKGWLLAAVGFLGKILGPLGWAWAVRRNHWPVSTGLLILTNDLIWWVPFAVYLREAWPSFFHDLKDSSG